MVLYDHLNTSDFNSEMNIEYVFNWVNLDSMGIIKIMEH